MSEPRCSCVCLSQLILVAEHELQDLCCISEYHNGADISHLQSLRFSSLIIYDACCWVLSSGPSLLLHASPCHINLGVFISLASQHDPSTGDNIFIPSWSANSCHNALGACQLKICLITCELRMTQPGLRANHLSNTMVLLVS